MKFGPIPVALAEGAILAHSIGLETGRLRKGTRLGFDDIRNLRAAGLEIVTVARLDADDLHEDDAALAVARALLPDPARAGLALKPVGTGRVNIVAQGPGVLRVDGARINALNAVDPVITVATLRDFMRLDPGSMVATVKIIAYGVARAAVAAASDAGQGGLCLLPPVLRRASLIQTWVDPGMDGRKGQQVTSARLERLGVRLTDTVMVAHQIAPLAQALSQASGDIVLILTGSATSDLHDTAPEALRHAGGQVVHFGMPVDPGNLLFLGQLGGRPVIGLPGCAKSPALNGADWVLERVVCGLDVTAADIMGMGVGGLLKEIPTRPRPRRHGENT
ncbi:molybdopterin-binding protein [Roseinatronobacter alkalisoli]|uniref:Molybdopterin-binding protein n=1 Tax=Roseinatronobacter alkalisoli TaxID=3028235 RepID=A0ABT5T5S2_9RHOB|nr:molybdopterin-binding protein [Roseinatronobacter sp. HJB301]MDD7970455.1 molybdopterin-binding protein [Roseinatronobacter sp. HJB301]